MPGVGSGWMAGPGRWDLRLPVPSARDALAHPHAPSPTSAGERSGVTVQRAAPESAGLRRGEGRRPLRALSDLPAARKETEKTCLLPLATRPAFLYIRNSMPPTPPIVLTIAGFDPSSGAGTTADIKTIAAHGCFGVGCITALTVQSTLGVRRSEPVSGKMIRDTLKELAADFTFAAVRIGMLGSADGVAAVVDFLKANKQANVVLDPVIRSSSGEPLLDDKGVERLRKELLPLATVITPNIDEAAALAKMPVTNVEQ